MCHKFPVHYCNIRPKDSLHAPSRLLQLQLRPITRRPLLAALLILIAAAAVVEIANLVTVKLGLLEALVDDVVRKAQPPGRGVAAARLRRVLGQQLPEVLRAVAARVEASEEVDEGLERQPVAGRGRLGEAGHHGVQELPRRAAELGSVGRGFLLAKGKVHLQVPSCWTKVVVGDGGSGLRRRRRRVAYLSVAFSSLGAIDSPSRMPAGRASMSTWNSDFESAGASLIGTAGRRSGL